MMTFPLALTLLFIGLKLTGYIDWSWWWVASPAILVFVLEWLKGMKEEWKKKYK